MLAVGRSWKALGTCVDALRQAAQRSRPTALLAPVEGGEKQEIPRNIRETLMCYVSTLNKIWSQEPTAQTGDICPNNNGALGPTVFSHSQFINGICFHSTVCETVTH